MKETLGKLHDKSSFSEKLKIDGNKTDVNFPQYLESGAGKSNQMIVH